MGNTKVEMPVGKAFCESETDVGGSGERCLLEILEVKANNHRKGFEVRLEIGDFFFPFAVCDTPPTPEDPIEELYIDPELANQAFTFVLASGREDAVHSDHVRSYKREPEYIREWLVQRLTSEAQDLLDDCGLSRRELARRLGTSQAQLYRLLDLKNCRKSIDSMVRLLAAMGHRVDFTIV